MKPTGRPVASLSLDLDNQWSYLKTRGDPAWRDLPSYLDRVVPRVLDLLADLDLKITVFVVGQDAAIAANAPVLRSIVAAGHDVGNHSFRHEPWLHRYGAVELEDEIVRAEEAILSATGQRPIGFRGPGYSFTAEALRLLQRRGYLYDASTFPTFVGPAARVYYFLAARLTAAERNERHVLFGSLRDGLRPLKPYFWALDEGQLLEIPVTTMPVARLPFHVSYLIYLARWSPALAQHYFRAALALCRQTNLAPSLLLHPLDFLGADDGIPSLAFFPGMDVQTERKLAWLRLLLEVYARAFDVLSLNDFARRTVAGGTAQLGTVPFGPAERPK